ncbi:uncharacterized protein BP01DRAFT_403196 [Aspergillus saccharolyticus JOP 1030-1]|uniref:C2H2-type domain-containing protein n=1 Tax=Aspergillus saccharolyticus JOP 1030-1 TaxID=1450539 RepID=A0A318Z9S6_9EURO|nr:hypothetical protein BP01DRAFT_403196 [Aspergillus saccharolyticus JOP 1030-1]PYH43177.1 hypothetical protein BP01DRAFT_403196 [Aspergillus saccharolyticus JOP 1030-1]
MQANHTMDVNAAKNKQVDLQVEECHALYRVLVQQKTPAAEMAPGWPELEAELSADYRTSSLSKLRTLPKTREFVAHALDNIKAAFTHPSPIRDGIWCDQAAFAFREAQKDAAYWIALVRTALRPRRSYELASIVDTSADYHVLDIDGVDIGKHYTWRIERDLWAKFPRATERIRQRLSAAKRMRWRILSRQRRRAPPDAPPQAPAVNTTPDGGGPFPPPPPPPQPLTPEHGCVICPYCNDAAPLNVCSDPAAWREHVRYDFHPYVCLHEQCSVDAAFADAEAWTAHMLEHHWGWGYFYDSNRCMLCRKDLTKIEGSATAHLRAHLEEVMMSTRASPIATRDRHSIASCD